MSIDRKNDSILANASADLLNSLVTEAIEKAEAAQDEAIRCWEQVARIESVLTEKAQTVTERNVAFVGLGHATTAAEVGRVFSSKHMRSSP